MKKKIVLCGATHGSNFGDSLFAYMFKKSIEDLDKEIEIIFTKASEHSRGKLGIRAASIKELLSSDAFIYISGGYFGESHNESLKGSLYRFLRYFLYGLIMTFRRKPIAILGVGAGPLNRSFLRKTAVYLFNKAKIVSVRDNISKEYMKNYGVKNKIEVTSDSAQVIDNNIFDINNSQVFFNWEEKVKDRKKILIHVNKIGNNDLYLENVIHAIKETLALNKNYGFVITSDSVISKEHLNKVYNELPDDRTVIYNFKDPLEFLNVIASVDSIITPKLHVGILASTYNKPV